MTQNEEMLRFIKGYDVVSEDALHNRFGLSFTATLKDLKAEGHIALKTEYKSLDGIRVFSHE